MDITKFIRRHIFLYMSVLAGSHALVGSERDCGVLERELEQVLPSNQWKTQCRTVAELITDLRDRLEQIRICMMASSEVDGGEESQDDFFVPVVSS